MDAPTVGALDQLDRCAGPQANGAPYTAGSETRPGDDLLDEDGLVGRELPKTEPVFWFMVQIAMLIGFATSCPVNAWLIAKGIKERM